MDVNAALALYPTSSKALRIRAQIHLHHENYTSALDDLQHALMYASTEALRRVLEQDLHRAEALSEEKKNEKQGHYAILGVFFVPAVHALPVLISSQGFHENVLLASCGSRSCAKAASIIQTRHVILFL